MTRVVVLGDALLDVVVRPSTSPRPGADVPATIRIGAGGQGANVAARLARRGTGIDLVCGLGADPAAELVRRAIEPDGVRLHVMPVDATGTVVILLDGAGERTMLSHRAPFTHLVDPATLPASDWTVVSGYVLLEADAHRVAGALAARRPGRRALLGCAVPEAASDTWMAASTGLRPDLVIVNRDEAPAFGGGLDGSVVVVTDADGAAATVGRDSVSVRAASGPPALDTTGAGDAFAAMLIATVRPDPWPPDRADLEAALGAAVRLASAVAREPGAQARVAGEMPEAGARG